MSQHDAFVDACRDFIDLTNRHVGAYVDACSGFAGNVARVERQVAKVMRQQKRKPGGEDGVVVILASFDDPNRPDCLHHRIVASGEFIAANSEAGSNTQMHAYSAIVFLFSKWDEVIRPKLATATGRKTNEIKLEVMGDLRILRNAILHNDAVLTETVYHQLKLLGNLLQPGVLSLSNEVMHAIFSQIKIGCAKLMCDYLGLPFTNDGPEAIKEIALPKTAFRYQFSGR